MPTRENYTSEENKCPIFVVILYSSSENIECNSIQAARKKYANNIKFTLDFYYYSQFYMATFQTATHGVHATLNAYLSFRCIY